MLSRVADNLYWMSRYLERAEHTSRLIDLALNQSLETPAAAKLRWERLLASLQLKPPPANISTAYHITRMLTFEPANRDSILTCIAAARENARPVREQISSEMWEQINAFYLRAKRNSIDEIWHSGPHEFFWSIREGSHLFQGITDATMTHGEGWHFIQLGRYIERAAATATLLDVHYQTLKAIQEAENYLEWVGLLKCCTAFEAYCKVYTADVRPDRIAEFLLLNHEFPRSVCFCAERIQHALEAISEATETTRSGRANRLAGRLRSTLSYSHIQEIMTSGLHAHLAEIQHQCAQIHTAIHETFISYPIDTALPS